MAGTATRFPEYVTDGHHIYVWIEEYEDMFEAGKLRACEAPVPPKVKVLSAKEKRDLEKTRQTALRDAEAAVRMLKAGAMATASAPTTPDTEDLFGSPPKDE